MDYRRKFLDFLRQKNALKIAGDPDSFFQLKSGRVSPSFISLGSLTDGASLITLKKCYSRAVLEGIEQGVLQDFAYVLVRPIKASPWGRCCARDSRNMRTSPRLSCMTAKKRKPTAR